MSPSLRIFFAMYKTSPAHCSIANGIGFAQQQATNQHATMLNEPKNASNVKNVEKYKPRLIFWKNHPMLSSTKRACFTAISASNSMCYMCWSDHITWLPCSCDKVFPNVACYKKIDATGKLVPAAPTRMASPPPSSPCEFVTPNFNNSVKYFCAMDWF